MGIVLQTICNEKVRRFILLGVLKFVSDDVLLCIVCKQLLVYKQLVCKVLHLTILLHYKHHVEKLEHNDSKKRRIILDVCS